MSIGFALREKYPIDENCKPISKYGSLGLFRAHEIPKIDAIVIDKPGLKVACGAIGIGEITSIPTAPAIADAYFRRDGVRRYSCLLYTSAPYKDKFTLFANEKDMADSKNDGFVVLDKENKTCKVRFVGQITDCKADDPADKLYDGLKKLICCLLYTSRCV